MRKIALLALPALLMASGCASLVTGKDEVVYIDTLPNKQAHCVVENERGARQVYRTPQHVSIARAKGPLSITCDTTDGWHGAVTIQAGLDPIAVVGAITSAGAAVVVGNAASAAGLAGTAAFASGAANAAVGGVASGLVDAETGAAFYYPKNIVVPLVPPSETLPGDAAVGPLKAEKAPEPPKAPSLHLK